MNISPHCAVLRHVRSLYLNLVLSRATPNLEDEPCPRIAARPSSSFATGMIPVKTTILPDSIVQKFSLRGDIKPLTKACHRIDHLWVIYHHQPPLPAPAARYWHLPVLHIGVPRVLD